VDTFIFISYHFSSSIEVIIHPCTRHIYFCVCRGSRFPCTEIGSVLGSLEHPVTTLEVYGALAADGESSNGTGSKTEAEVGGSGGGSGGSLLLFLASVSLGNESLLSSGGGIGGFFGGGGGGGGRVHFHWSKILTGEEYLPVATGVGSIVTRYQSYCSNSCPKVLPES
jgi:hypothetical protein